MKVNGFSWGFMVICFFESDMQYKLHYTSAAAFPWLVIYFILGVMVLRCFRFSASGKNTDELIFGGIIPLLHTGGGNSFNSTMVKWV